MKHKKISTRFWIVTAMVVAVLDVAILFMVFNFLFARPSMEEQGGTRLTYRMDWEEALALGTITEQQYEDREQLLAMTMRILRERIDPRGRAGVEFQLVGDDRFVIDLPTTEDLSEEEHERVARSLIESSGAMQFYIHAEAGDFASLGTDLATEVASANAWRQENPDAEWTAYNRQLASREGEIANLRFFNQVQANQVGERVDVGIKPLWKQKDEWTFTGDDLYGVNPTTDRMGYPAVALHLDMAKEFDFSRFTGENIDRGLAIVLNDVIVSLANIRTTLGADFIIEGQFTPPEVMEITRVLRSGSLVVKPELQSAERVAPKAD